MWTLCQHPLSSAIAPDFLVLPFLTEFPNALHAFSLSCVQWLRVSLSCAASWVKVNAGNQSLERMTPEQAHRYLSERAETVRQKILDLDR